MIALTDVHKAFGAKQVLRGLTLDVAKGESCVIIGGSGTGKSVCLKCILGLVIPDKGQITVGGQDVTTGDRDAFLARFGMLFQGGALFDSMPVWQNVAFRLQRGAQKRPKLEARETAIEKLRRVGLTPDVADLYPSELSGGMQKRVGLARAIAAEPEIIFFDEPTTGLDPIRADLINELILRLQKSLRVTGIVVTHDLASAFKVADRMIMLHEGRIVLDGTPQAFRESEHPIVGRFLRGEASQEDLASIAMEESAPELANRRRS